jgi:hypothetical protein
MRIGLFGVVAAAMFLGFSSAAPADDIGTFVIGNGSDIPGATVEFWGAQWWKLNSVSGESAPPSFKGFAVTVNPDGPCSGTFTTRPGDSSDPPPTIASEIPVLVTDDVTKSGAVISGHYSDIVMVSTDPGYGPDPGHPGTGTVLGSICGSGSPPPAT